MNIGFDTGEYNMTNYRRDIEQLLDEWVDEPGQGKNIVNCMVDWLWVWIIDEVLEEYCNAKSCS